MKIDKATLIKNQFWILLGTAVAFTLLGWLLLLLTVPGAVAKDRNAVDNAWKAKKSPPKIKSKEYVTLQEKETRELQSQQVKVQSFLFNAQAIEASCMSWPKMLYTDGKTVFDLRDGFYPLDVTILPLPKEKDKEKKSGQATAGKDNKITGILLDTDQEWLKVRDEKDKNKIHLFLRSTKTKITDNSGPTKITDFGQLGSRQGHPVVVTYYKGKSFGEELSQAEIRAYAECYRDQLTDVLKDLDPVNRFGDQVVQLRYVQAPFKPKKKGEIAESNPDVINDCWIFKPNKKPLQEPPPTDNRFLPYPVLWTKNPREISSDEVWATQETMWVQHEIFRQIKATNDSLAAFEMVGPKSADGKSACFRNFYWEVELSAAKGGINVKLTNLRPNWQPVENLRFLARFKDPKDAKAQPSEQILIPPAKSSGWQGYPVGPAGGGLDVFPNPKSGDKTTTKFIAMPDVNLTGFYSLDQVLTVETAAVKRIDMISVGASPSGEPAVSYRHDRETLIPYNVAKKAAKIVDPNLAAEVKPPSSEDEEARVEMIDTKVKMTANQVLLDRYLKKTSTSRKLPVGMVFIVGQEHITRVQAALISSPLRFLETQVLWQRYQLTLGGTTPDANSPPIIPGLPAPPPSGAGIQENVELHLYGVITLYERPNQQAPPDKK